MYCPKCGTENPDESKICVNCSYVLIELKDTKEDVKAKKSILAIGSALLSAMAAILMILLKPTIAFLFALFSITAAISSIRKIKKSKGKLVGKSFAIASITYSTLNIVLLSYWRIDAPPIPVDYTIADLRSAPTQYNESYKLLLSLSDKDPYTLGAPAIGLSEQDVNNLDKIYVIFKKDDYDKTCAELKANKKDILQIWQNAKKGIEIINELDKFPEITDLTEPDPKYELSFIKNFRHLVHLYTTYICFQSSEGNEDTALKEFLKLDNIVRKLDINARPLVMKLVCMACSDLNIQTADFIINNPQDSEVSLKLLSEHFAPLKVGDISLRNSIIFEYLIIKNELVNISQEKKLKYSSFSPLKLNSTLRLYKNFCNDWIAASEENTNISKDNHLTVWPSIYPDLPVQIDPNGNMPLYYKVYNQIGAMFLEILMPSYKRILELKTKLEVKNDLLQIVLNKRLGKEINLKARAYSDEYIVDIENKKIFSPGPDRIPHNKDDIKLLINPDVFKWNN